MKFLKMKLLVLCGLFLFSGSALALSLDNGSVVGQLDTVLAFDNIENSYAAELAWLHAELGDSVTFTEDDKFEVTDDQWNAVVENEKYFAMKLNEPATHYFIKLGTGSNTIEYSHWLYENAPEFDWAVVNTEEWGTAQNIDIFRVSHIGEVGSSPVPEPATLFLFGVGLLGLGGVGRKKIKI